MFGDSPEIAPFPVSLPLQAVMTNHTISRKRSPPHSRLPLQMIYDEGGLGHEVKRQRAGREQARREARGEVK